MTDIRTQDLDEPEQTAPEAAPTAPTAPPAPAPSPAPPAAPRWAGGPAQSVAGSAVIAGGALVGLWFLPFVAGAVIGAVGRRRSVRRLPAFATAGAAAVLGWTWPLAGAALAGRPVAGIAATTAALAGLPALAAVTVALTLLVALVQAAAGLWLGRTLLPRPAATAPATAPAAADRTTAEATTPD